MQRAKEEQNKARLGKQVTSKFEKGRITMRHATKPTPFYCIQMAFASHFHPYYLPTAKVAVATIYSASTFRSLPGWQLPAQLFPVIPCRPFRSRRGTRSRPLQREGQRRTFQLRGELQVSTLW